MGESGTTIILVVIVLLFLALNVFVRSRKAGGTPLGRVVSILAEVNHNEKLVANFGFTAGARKFKTGAWRKYNNKVDFLPHELRMVLAKAFEMSEEVNERINAARKFKSTSYMAGIDVDKLKAPLARSKQQLQEWLQENMQNPEFMPKRRGLFG